MLCALHHPLLHNRHWKILLQGSRYWLKPPIEINPEQTLIYLPSKNPLMHTTLKPDLLTSAPPAAGTADSRQSRNSGLNVLDQHCGDGPNPHNPRNPHGDYED
ncbi:hypothetical protein [Cryobacterium sp. Hb1]|uniref:hypothetical protein n=1 Tax=Cryobacterium sp. Hb1 TaxID=1259147 RepID=UPI001068E5AF|nr:hypothetical protein [Cryobacterium sp. Hb1]TFD71791.1 hypothetical protein E3T38_03115 [Cryobacterium sp. Hb1]